MAITTYSELQSAMTNWMARSDISSSRLQEAISMAEARLNRKLMPVLTSATLTGTQSARTLSVASQSVAEPIGLFLISAGVNDRELTRRMDGTFDYSLSDGVPSQWGMEGTNIVFDCPLSSALTFRFKFRQRFALSDSATTNWLLTNHPDIYLAACILWGGLYSEDDGKALKWATVLEQGIPEIKSYIARQNLAIAQLDPALSSNGRFGLQDWQVA